MTMCKNQNTGDITPVLPVLYAHLADTPEAMRALALFGGNAEHLQMPCWSCQIPGYLLHSLDLWPERDYKKLSANIRQWQMELLSGIRKTADIQNECKKESTFLLRVCYFFIVLQ